MSNGLSLKEKKRKKKEKKNSCSDRTDLFKSRFGSEYHVYYIQY